MIPWWPITLAFVGALIVAVGTVAREFITQSWPRYVILCGMVLAAIGGLGFAIHQVSYQTGGDSFAYLEPGFLYPTTPKDDLVMMSLMHRGLYPLYDLSIRVVDLEKFHEHVAQNPRGLLLSGQYTQHYTWPRLDAETSAPFFTAWQLPHDRDEQSYNMWIASPRNFKRGVFQQLRFRRIDGEWRVALRVMRDNQVLIQDGRQYLPRDEKGQAIWEKGMGDGRGSMP